MKVASTPKNRVTSGGYPECKQFEERAFLCLTYELLNQGISGGGLAIRLNPPEEEIICDYFCFI